MKTLRAYPLGTSHFLVGLAALWFLLPVVIAPSDTALGEGEQERGVTVFTASILSELFLCAFVLLAIGALGWWKETGFTARIRPWALLLMVPPLAFTVLVAFAPYLVLYESGEDLTEALFPVGALPSVLLMAVLVAVFEEGLFRGCLLYGLKQHMPAVLAVIVAAFLFGAMHLVNWAGGQPLDITMFQVVSAFGGGVLYGALALWTGSIWPGIILHGLWDAAVTLQQEVSDQLPSTLEHGVSAAGDAQPSLEAALRSPELFYGALLLFAFLLRDWMRRQRQD